MRLPTASALSYANGNGTAPLAFAPAGNTIGGASGSACEAARGWLGAVLLMLLAVLFAVPGRALAQTFQTLPALSFTKVYAGGDPPAQVITAASTGAAFSFNSSVVNSTGGNWLTVNPNTNNLVTPRSIIVSANPVASLAAGTYSAQITLSSSDGKRVALIPVSLLILPASSPSFDATAGALTFSVLAKGSAPPLQNVPIRNAGSGTLNWIAVASTSDGGNWLMLSAASGTAPSALQAGLIPGNLPGAGLVAGTFVGQVVLQADGDRVTIPVTVTVGASLFRQLNPLSFTMAYQGGNPPAQVMTAASTGAVITFNSGVVNSTGGNWLTINPNNVNLETPRTILASAAPANPLPVGTYTAEIILTAGDGTQASVVPVTLTVEPPTVPFFDETNGGLAFFMMTKGSAPPLEDVPIRNAGSGTLNWTASTSTADGGSWLTLSAASGTAPSSVQVGVNPANLPGAGLVAGTFVGQVVLLTDGDRTTIPVTVTVGDSVFRQINPLSFTKAYQGNDPPAQVITASSTGAAISFSSEVVNSTGGNWLTISPNNVNLSTPRTINVSANPSVALGPGTYTAEIVLNASDGTQASVVPVSLLVAPPTASFFDEINGELTFSMMTKGSAPPMQMVPIRNAGSGTLNWTAAANTADGGNWLTLSATSGTAPSSLQVAIMPGNLPGAALSAGVFTGQIVLQTDGDRTTVPVTVTVGTSVFRQLNPLSFTMAYQGANPPSQLITAASTGAAFSFNSGVVNSTGGAWLTISPNNVNLGTPRSILATVSPANPLPSGTYTAEIILTAGDGTQASVVPVTLTVAPPTVPFFDETDGALTFFMQTATSAPPAKAVPIRNAGNGTLNWTASASTADGGSWIILSAPTGTAPSTLSVAVDPTYLPGQGLSAGTFVGQVVLQTDSDTVTVPVTFTVGTSVFESLGALSFSKIYQGANPSSQTITANSTGSTITFNSGVLNSTGGSWLSISPNNVNLTTPRAITVSATPASSLAAGTYTAEIILTSTDGTQASVIPVFLTVGTTQTPTPAPTFSAAGGTYTAPVSVTLVDSTAGATIYYTTDGSMPTTGSAQYGGAIAIASSTVLKAVAIAPGSTLSNVSTATYTFVPVSVSPTALNFGNQVAGATSAVRGVVLTNPGMNSLVLGISTLAGTNAADFTFDASACSGTLAGGGSCSVAVTFTPHAQGGSSATLTFQYGGTGSPVSVALSGTGTAGAAASLSIASIPSASAQTTQTVVVRALDAQGNVVPSFAGTVTLSGTDPTATFAPSSYTYTAADAGSHTFTITFNTAGMFSLSASSGTLTGTRTGIVVLDSIWVLGENGGLVRFTASGAPATATGSTSGHASQGAIAFDHAGSLWATQTDLSLVNKYTATGVGVPLLGLSAAGVNLPAALFVDGLGQVWIANTGTSSISVLSNSGDAISPATGYQPGTLSSPSGLVVDSAGSVWVTNRGSNSVTKLFGAAAPVVAPIVLGTGNNTLGTRP